MKLKLNLNFKVNQKRKDINFFSLEKKKQTVAVAGILVVIIPIMLVGAMFAAYTYNTNQIDNLNAAYNAETKKLADINLKEKQPILQRATVKRDILANYYSWADSLNTQLGNYKIVPSQLLEDMTAAAGKEITCTSVAARDNVLEFSGTAPSYSAIANYQKACSEIFGVKEAFVSTIEKETTSETVMNKARKWVVVSTDTYVFTMTVKFGEKPEDAETVENTENTDTADTSAKE